MSLITRLKSALILAPAILIVLIWIGVFAGGAAVAFIGIPTFLALSVVAAITTAYCISLYVSYVRGK